MLQQKLKFDIFQKALFCTKASSTNLVLNTVPIAAGQYLQRGYFFLLKPDHFWSFHAFSKTQKLKGNFQTWEKDLQTFSHFTIVSLYK